MKNENTTATLPVEQVEETSETSQKPKKKKVTRRVLLGGSLGTLAVAGVGAGWAYNRYLAEHTQIDDTVAYEKSQQAKNNNSSSDGASSPSELTNVKVTSDGLSANEGSITITKSTEGSGNNAVVSFAAEIKLNAMTLLRGAFANNKFGQNIIDTPSNIAAQHNGIWAINGDYYGFRDTGIVIRNGVAYRDSGAREGLAFYQDGSVKLYDETGTNAQQLLNEGVWNTLSFGPALVRDSEVVSGIDQVEVDTKGLDGSTVTYIYVDGIEAQKGNMGDSQQSVTLQGDALKAGTHTIEVVQFKGDDTKGEVVFYRKVIFEIAN